SKVSSRASPLSGARKRQPTALLALSASECRRKKHFACYRPLRAQADRCNIRNFTTSPKAGTLVG
ncbi:MAG: hypothetical protein ACXW48_19525, partial [Candidatus Binatia bacterium]